MFMNSSSNDSRMPEQYIPFEFPISDLITSSSIREAHPPLGYPTTDRSTISIPEDYPPLGYPTVNRSTVSTTSSTLDSIPDAYPPMGYPTIYRSTTSMTTTTSSSGPEDYPPLGYPTTDTMDPPLGYPINHHKATSVFRNSQVPEPLNLAGNNSDNYFLPEHHDFHVSQHGLDHGFYVGQPGHRFKIVSPHARKTVDPRVLALVEFCGEFFVERRELFKNTFPGMHDELLESFKKLGDKVAKAQSNRPIVKTMERNLSFDSPRTAKVSEESTVRLERFKLKPMGTKDNITGAKDQAKK